MKTFRKTIAIFVLLLMLFCTGCGNKVSDSSGVADADSTQKPAVTETDSTASKQGKEVYTLQIKINPAFTIGYDEKHIVTSLHADNQDAQDILDKYFQENPVGGNLDTVSQQLIIKAYTDGYAADDFQVELSFVGEEDVSDYWFGLENLIDEYVADPYPNAEPYTVENDEQHTDPAPVVDLQLEQPEQHTCPDCGGSGQQPCSECGGAYQIPCEYCSGTGVTMRYGEDEEYADVTCDMCHGSGEREKIVNGDVVGMETCPNCGGKGTRYLSTGNTIVHEDEMPCPQCEGRGWNPCGSCENGYFPCERCRGEGTITD